MTRPLRLEVSGGVYHVTARGNDRQRIFEDDEDCQRFLMVLASIVDRYAVVCHAYCLMGNHYHLLLQTQRPNLSRGMRQLNGVYTQRFNRRHERTGHVLQGRYGARLVDGHAYLHEVCRYIVLNPVRAGVVAHPREWRWSSFAATAGEAPVPGFLTVDWVLSMNQATSRAASVRRYRDFVEAGLDQAEDALEQFGSKLALGDRGFVAAQAEQCRAAVWCPEYPRAQRFGPRLDLAEIFANVTSRRDRDARVVVAVRDHGYTMRDVADYIGRHYVTVSRALAGAGRMVPPEAEMSECKT